MREKWLRRPDGKDTAGSGNPRALVAGKFWVDGQNEPEQYTIGPRMDDSTQLNGGYGGFSSADTGTVFFVL